MNYKIQLQGLHCDACKMITQKRLERLEGVGLVTIDLGAQTALIQRSSLIVRAQVEDALKDTDYKIINVMEV